MAIEKVINIKVQETGLDALNQDLTKTTQSIKGVDEASNKLNNDLEKSEFKTFKTQLKEANVELQKMSSLFGETSEEAVNAAKNVAKIKDEMEFQKDLIKSYNPDEKFRALSQTAGIATLALGGVKDGLSAFGIESEKLDKIIGGAQGILGATSAISGIADAYQLLTASKKATAVASETLAGAELAEAGATDVATTSAGALAVAEGIVLAPITLIVAGVALLVGGFLYFKDSIMALLPSLQAFTDFIGNAYNAVTDFIGLTSEASRAFDKIAEDAKKSAELNNKFLAEEGDTLNKYTKAKIDAKQRYNEAVQKDGADQVALANRLNRELAGIDKQHQDDLKTARDESAKKLADAQKIANDKRLADEKESNRKLKEEEDRARQERNDFDKAVLDAKAEQTVKDIQESTTTKEEQKKAFEDGQDELLESSDAFQAENDAIKDKDKKSDKAILDAKKANTEQIKNLGGQLLNSVVTLAGKNKAIQKTAIIADSGIALGKVGMSTAEAISKDSAKGFPISIALMALDAAVGVASAISIVANTKKALSAVGGGSAPSADNNQLTPPTTAPAFNLSEGTTQGAIALANQNKQEPIKAYVVGQDVTTQQQLDLKTQQTASFG